MADVTEKPLQFERRKQDHIRLSLDEASQSANRSSWDRYRLQHNAFPEINFQEVDISTSFFSTRLQAPFFISSMTAGHEQGVQINERLAYLSQNKQILMGVGSQRRELNDTTVAQEWMLIRKKYPKSLLLSNIGITQVITHKPTQIFRLIESTQALALIVHVNPLQEALQAEGTPQFRGGLKALEALVKESPVPVIVKEVGCSFSQQNLKALQEMGVSAVDLSGKSGTHWGRIEGLRSQNEITEKVSRNFMDWGDFALDTLVEAKKSEIKIPLWVSGGVRSGVDVAKSLAFGADLVGLAQPWLKAAVQSEEQVEFVYRQIELELKTALFCTGAQVISQLKGKGFM